MVKPMLNQMMKFILARFRSYQLERLVDRGLLLGRNVNIQPGVVLDPSHCWNIKICDDVTLAPGVHVLAHDASTKYLTGLTRIGKVEIQEGVFIGANSTILPGVTIGKHSIIGAGSVVTRDVPPNVVASGNPVKILSSTDEFALKHKKAQAQVKCYSEEYTIEKGITKDMKDEIGKSLDAEKFNYLP